MAMADGSRLKKAIGKYAGPAKPMKEVRGRGEAGPEEARPEEAVPTEAGPEAVTDVSGSAATIGLLFVGDCWRCWAEMTSS
jgi:hypothetical protein